MQGRRQNRATAIAFLLGAAACSGPDRVAQQPLSEGAQHPTWQPPSPDPDAFDWLQLTSGEWLKGELIILRSGRIEFDSEELDEQSFDVEDVALLRSSRVNTVVRGDREALRGPIAVRDGEVSVDTSEGPRTFPLTELNSIVPGDSLEQRRWKGRLSLGVTAQRGNTEQSTTTAQASVTGRSAFSRITLDYIGNLAETEGAQTANNHRANGQWDVFLSRRFFVTPASVALLVDRIQNIAYQVTPGAGVGYHLLDEPGGEWDVTLAGGWRYTRYVSVPPGDPDHDSTAAIVPGTQLEWDVTDDVEFGLDYSIQIGVPDTEETNHNLVANVSVDLVGDLDLDVTFQWTRIGEPQADDMGRVAKEDDYRTTIGLGLEF